MQSSFDSTPILGQRKDSIQRGLYGAAVSLGNPGITKVAFSCHTDTAWGGCIRDSCGLATLVDHRFQPSNRFFFGFEVAIELHLSSAGEKRRKARTRF